MAESEKAKEARLIRQAIEIVLKNTPNVRLITLQQEVCKIVPFSARYEQIEYQIRMMSDAEIKVDRTPRKNYLYSWAGGEPKQRIRAPRPSRAIGKDANVKQFIVPFTAGVSRILSGPVKSPMEWSVDCLGRTKM